MSATILLSCSIDAKNPLALPVVGENELTLLTPTLLELNLVTTKAPDPAIADEWNFVGPNFSPGRWFRLEIAFLEIFVLVVVNDRRRRIRPPVDAGRVIVEIGRGTLSAHAGCWRIKG